MKKFSDAEKVKSYETTLRNIWPKTVRQAAEMLVAFIDPDERDRILLIPEAQGMIKYHHSIGRWVRNNFGLWWTGTENDLLGNTWIFEDAKKKHPDDVSHMILTEAWRVLREHFPQLGTKEKS